MSLFAVGGGVAVISGWVGKKVDEHISNPFSLSGPSEAGKSTLLKQLRGRAPDVGEIQERTARPGKKKSYRIRYEVDDGVVKKKVRAQDVPGQREWWSVWPMVAAKLKSKLHIHVSGFEHIDLTLPIEKRGVNRAAFEYMVDCLCGGLVPIDAGVLDRWRMKRHMVELVVLVINKWDLWSKIGNQRSNEFRFQDGSIYRPIYCWNCGAVDGCDCGEDNLGFHPVFEPFREGLRQLSDSGIKSMLWISSFRFDPDNIDEMFKKAFSLID